MAEQPADRHGPLAFSGELRPVVSDGSVEVEPPLLSEDVGGNRNHSLRRRHDHLKRVRVVWIGTAGSRRTTPQIHDLASIQVDAEGGADLAVIFEVGGERLSDRFKARFDRTRNLSFDHQAALPRESRTLQTNGKTPAPTRPAATIAPNKAGR